jgi:hypothetical protein
MICAKVLAVGPERMCNSGFVAPVSQPTVLQAVSICSPCCLTTFRTEIYTVAGTNDFSNPTSHQNSYSVPKDDPGVSGHLMVNSIFYSS